MSCRVTIASKLDTRTTDAAADIAGPAIVAFKIEQRIAHQRNDAAIVRNIKIIVDHAKVGSKPGVERDTVDVEALVAKFAFEAEEAEIVAGNCVDIEAVSKVNRLTVVETGGGARPGGIDVEVEILDDHRAAFDPHIGASVASECGSGDGNRGSGGEQITAHSNSFYFVPVRGAP
jgi:hypothetical protein